MNYFVRTIERFSTAARNFKEHVQRDLLLAFTGLDYDPDIYLRHVQDQQRRNDIYFCLDTAQERLRQSPSDIEARKRLVLAFDALGMTHAAERERQVLERLQAKLEHESRAHLAFLQRGELDDLLDLVRRWDREGNLN